MIIAGPFVSMLHGLLLTTSPQMGAAPPDPPCFGIECGHDGGGIEVGMTLQEVIALAEEWPSESDPQDPASWFEYVAVIDCIPPNSPENPRLEICTWAVTFCEDQVPDSVGPRSWIYRRTVSDDGTTSGWVELSPTCFTSSVPPRSGEPAEELTDAMILEQFHRTDFALPEIVIQPPDGQTLVNLPVYFQLSWPAPGFEPGEVDTTTIVGHEVRIRPTLVGVTYITGDGASIGPTTSPGGPYPTGDITHEYTVAAEVTPHIRVEYGGEVSVDGGAWSVIPGSATVEGPGSPLRVLTSQNRLYSN